MKWFGYMERAPFIVLGLILAACSILPGAWFDPDWSYRRPIALDNSLNTDTLFDFQIKMDIPYDTDMQPDFDDIRFTSDDSISSLPYWIAECYQGNRAVVYVKVPIIPGGDSTYIFMYYGNPNAASESDGYAVFEYFDDFADGNIDDWFIIGGTWTAGNRFLEQLETANYRRILGPCRNLNASITEATLAYLSTYEYAGNHIFFTTDSSAENGYFFGFDGLTAGGEGTCIARVTGSANILVSDPAINVIDYAYVRLRAKIIYDGAGNYAFHLKAPDSAQVYIEVSDYVYTGPYIIAAWVGSHICIDDIRVRKYARNEPAYEIGEEQTPSAIEENKKRLGICPPVLSVVSSNPGDGIHLLLEITASSHVSGAIYDCTGKRTHTIIPSQKLAAGTHEFDINGSSWPVGIYFALITISERCNSYPAKEHQLHHKFLILK